MDRTFKKLDTYTGWALFIFASVVYILTSEPTASFWDCGEYIATAFKLQVGHPPGAPLFQMIGRFFSMFAFGDTSHVARMVNTMSALSSGLTIAFLFWSITLLARKLFRNSGEMSHASMYTIIGSGLAGALAYTFSDSFWYSAVEGEVYAMSSLFTAMVFWAILRWEAVADEPHAFRWIILIALLIGLSIGVHLLSLLVIPATTLVYYFKKSKKISWKGIVLVLLFSFVLVAAVMYGIIPEIVTLFANTELLFVNTLGLPFNSGSIFFALLLVSLITLGILYTIRERSIYIRVILALGVILLVLFFYETSSFGDFIIRLLAASAVIVLFRYWRKKKDLINAVLLGFTFILIGYSSFIMLIIRANADTPINENNPDNAINLLAYLNREQYGSTPLFYGPYYNAPLIDRKDGKPVYEKDYKTDRYVISDDRKNTVPVYDPAYMTIFPRMWNNQDDQYIENYKNWAGIRNDPQNKHIPTFGENLSFFVNYQLNHMYFRYLFWNFIGRQNDNQGFYADILNGNWISGIEAIDNSRLGPQNSIPDSLKNKAHNTFFFLPLIFGLIGLYYHFKRNYKDGLVVMALFFMTGLAIEIYLNMQAPQPRERDYAFAASFYAYAIWIGLSVPAVYELLCKKLKPVHAAILAGAAVLLLVPVIMGQQGWNDHDRSGRYTALQMAKNYLNSCARNAIIFTNGDNDTFPLWYAQEVESIRTDVRIVNLSLLNTDWYIDQMKKKAYESDPVPFSLTRQLYKNGSHDVTYLLEQDNIKGYVEAKELFNILKMDETKLQLSTSEGIADYFPAKKFVIPADPSTVVANGTVPASLAGQVHNVEWKIDRPALTKNYLMMLDLLANNNWERPIYYVTTTSDEAYLGLKEYFQLEGLAYRFVPVKAPLDNGNPSRVNTDVMFDNVMNKFEFSVTRPGLYLNDDHVRMAISMRNVYAELAQALVMENKMDSAVKVCDRSIELIPDKVIPYNYFNLAIASSYLAAGQNDKGNAILQRMVAIQDERLSYYLSFPEDKRTYISFEIQQCLALLNALNESAERYKQEDSAAKAKKLLELYYNLYVGKQYTP